MRNLINFIWKHYFIFLFLLIQAVCFLLLFQYNNFHKAYFLNLTAEVSGSTYSMVNNLTEYLKLKEVNTRLLQENQELKSKLKGESYYSLQPNVMYFNDSLYRKKYEYLGAKIINNSVDRRNNYITINRGIKHGVKPEMGLVTDQGVLGVVREVSPNFSVALSLLHGQAKVSARLKKNNYFGIISWNGKSPYEVTLSDIPNHVNVKKGDTVVTRGSSTIFPPEIPIGEVIAYEEIEGEIFYAITLKLFEDFKNVPYGYVVKNMMKMEQDTLEQSVTYEDGH